MDRRFFTVVVLIVLLVVVPNWAGAGGTVWKSIGKGLEYTSIRVSPGIVHAFRIDPKIYKFGVVTAKDLGRKNASVKSMAKRKGALIAINGGFFTPEYESLGLLIDNGQTINPLRNTSWWSVFYVRDSSPNIVHTKSFRRNQSISMAVQSGPRLLINGFVPRLKPSIAERSAICISGKKDVIIVATENLLVQPKELAHLMRKKESRGGLGCRTALNLDGGSSTQLYAKVGSFKLSVAGTNKVTNAVVVYPKSK